MIRNISWLLSVGIISCAYVAFAYTPPIPHPPTEHEVIATGSGEAKGSCDGSANQVNCFEALKETAEEIGGRQAENMCLSQGGSFNGSTTCLTQCDPEELSAGA